MNTQVSIIPTVGENVDWDEAVEAVYCSLGCACNLCKDYFFEWAGTKTIIISSYEQLDELLEEYKKP